MSARALAPVIDRKNALIRPSSPRSCSSSSTTARYSRSSSAVRVAGGVTSPRSSTSIRRCPSRSVLAAPGTARCRPMSDTANPRPGSFTRSVTSATTPTVAYSRPRLGSSRMRSSVPGSTDRVTGMPGNTTVSSREISL